MFVSTRSLFSPGGESECVETSSPRPSENHQGTNKSDLSAGPSLAAKHPKTFPPRLQFRCSAPLHHLFLTPARPPGGEGVNPHSFQSSFGRFLRWRVYLTYTEVRASGRCVEVTVD